MVLVVLVASFVVLFGIVDVMVDRVVVAVVLLTLIGDAIAVVVELFIVFCEGSSSAVVVVDVDGIIVVASDVLIIGFGILIFVVDGLVVFVVIIVDEAPASVV